MEDRPVEPVRAKTHSRSIVERYPLLFVLVLLLAWVLPDWALSQRSAESLRFALVQQAVMGASAAALITWLGWWREAGFNGPDRWRHVRVTLIPLFGVAMLLRGIGQPSLQAVALYGLLALLTAFQEEAWHRGVLLRTLLPVFGRRRSAALSALLFGAVHAVYLFDEAPGITLIRAFGTGLCGFTLAALRLRTRSIWPGMLVSWLFYAGTFLSRGVPRGEDLLPPPANRLALQAFLVVVIFGCARRWMRAVPDLAQEEEAQRFRVS
jgi:membrane protease YdiL (CAAX protease family)